jgi:chromatin modification-related protein VID21
MTGNDEMDLDADGEADADGDTEKSRERSMSSFAKVAVAGDAPTTSKPGTATSTPVPEGRLVASSSSISTTPGSHAPIQSDAQKAAQATLLQIQTIMSLRAPIFELPVSATIVDPASLSSPTTSSPGPLSLGTLFPDLPIYSDFQLAADFPSDKRIEESSAWAGRLSNVSKHFDSRPLLVSTVVPSKTRGREGGWDPMTKNWLDEAREIVPDHRDQPVSRSSK